MNRIRRRNEEEQSRNNSQQSIQKSSRRGSRYSLGSNTSSNPGITQYEKGLRSIERKKKNREKQLKEKQKQEVKECRFKPRINEISKMINSIKCQLDNGTSQRRDRQQKSLEKIQQQKMQKEIEQCSFKPEINQISKQIVQIKESMKSQNSQSSFGKNKWQQLHEDDRRRFKNNPQIFPFSPSINNQSRNIKQTFQQRQDEFQQQQSQKKLLQQAIRDQMIDPVTCVPFFSPQINHYPSEPSSTKHDRYLKMYDQSKQMEKRRLQKQVNSYNQSRNFSPNNKSHQLVEQMKMKRFFSMFQQLDRQQKGFIDFQDIKLDDINPTVMSFIHPLLVSLQETGQQISLDEFMNITQQMFDKLSVMEKNKVLNAEKEDEKKKKQKLMEPTFQVFVSQYSKPSINSRSKKIGDSPNYIKTTTQNKNSFGSNSFVYDYNSPQKYQFYNQMNRRN